MYVGFYQEVKIQMIYVCLVVLKDPLESKNQDKKNYYLKCMGKLKDVEFKKKKVLVIKYIFYKIQIKFKKDVLDSYQKF